MIYFNQAAGSFPKAPGVAAAVAAFLNDGAFNVGRGADEGAGELVYRARLRLASFFGCAKAKHVIFTPGVTASLNTLIFGWLKRGDHVITTALEHNAVLRPLHAAAAAGVTFSVAPADATGQVDPAQIEALIRPDSKAVLVSTASNVSGTYLPLAAIASICRRRGLRLLVDTAQTAGSAPIGLAADGIDAIGFTAHKGLLGPQGIGGLVLNEPMAAEVRPFMFGGTGSQSHLAAMPARLPDRLEAGTLNLPGIAGLLAALDYLEATGLVTIAAHERQLTAQFLAGAAGLPAVRVVGPSAAAARTAVVSLDFPGKDNGLIAAALAERGIVTRSGLHCAPLAHRALGTFPRGTVRFSFGCFNTAAEVQECLDVLMSILKS